MNRIKELRESKHIKQRSLAEAALISQPYLYDLENGRRGAKQDTKERIAAALDVTVQDLFRKDEGEDDTRTV